MGLRPAEPVEDESVPDELSLIEPIELKEMRVEESSGGGESQGAAGGEKVKEARVGAALEEARLLTEGDCFEAKVAEIRLGRFGEFVPPPRDERFQESYERRKDRMAYLFILETPFGRFRDVLVVSAHRNSRMAQLARCYKTIKVGQRVRVCIENGKPRITC